MTAPSSEERVRAVRRLLESRGIAGAVSVAGMEGDIAAVRGPARLRSRLAELAPEIRSLGFRYVALEPEQDNHYDEGS